jgi:hypothetical protein
LFEYSGIERNVERSGKLTLSFEKTQSMAIPSAILLGAVVSVVTAVSVAIHGRPGPERDHLFETEDDERTSPLGEFSAGAARADESCRGCGSELPAETYSYCGACMTVADD